MGTTKNYNKEQLHELLHQALETEIRGVDIYTEALRCAVNETLREAWTDYLEETKTHCRKLEAIFGELGLDTEGETPGRTVVRHLGEALATAIGMAREAGNDRAAELVATECVMLAETKGRLNWKLLGDIAQQCEGYASDLLREPCALVEMEGHLYRTRGYCRELWLYSFGLAAALPPPAEQKNVETPVGVERAKHAGNELMRNVLFASASRAELP